MYPSDVSDEQWSLLEPYFRRSDPRGARSKYSKRAILNGILYVLRGGIQWRMLPKDLPPWETVYNHFYRLKERGVWDQIMVDLTRICRTKIGREPNPSYAIMDAQTIKTKYYGSSRGYDGGKKSESRTA